LDQFQAQFDRRRKSLEFYPPFVRGEEIYVTYHDQLWFSKSRDGNYDFLRTFRTPSNLPRFLDKNLASLFFS